MDSLYGFALYGITLLTMGGIFALLSLGLNIQWGYTGLFNAGIAGFVAIGAYVSAILTTAPSPLHLGGFDQPLLVGGIAAMVLSGLVAWVVARICLRLRADYLAIATIGIGEILRLIFKNESWATNGARGIVKVPKAFESLPAPMDQLAFLALVLAVVSIVYLLLERAHISPWGRLIAAIRDDEQAAAAAGKDVVQLRIQSFILGAVLMGLAGAFLAQYLKFIGPNATDPLTTTFLVWVMLIAGGSGSNRGAILGAFLIWAIWSMTEILAGILPGDLALRVSHVRIFIVGLALQIILQRFPQGIVPENRPNITGGSS
ncbi:MAG: branched-chain amino acid ABC transporter permease [Pseudomonadota bacterium]